MSGQVHLVRTVTSVTRRSWQLTMKSEPSVWRGPDTILYDRGIGAKIVCLVPPYNFSDWGCGHLQLLSAETSCGREPLRNFGFRFHCVIRCEGNCCLREVEVKRRKMVCADSSCCYPFTPHYGAPRQCVRACTVTRISGACTIKRGPNSAENKNKNNLKIRITVHAPRKILNK